MPRLRISSPARADLAAILTTSRTRWGEAARARYAALLGTALRTLARTPEAHAARDRPELAAGVRSFHVRHARGARGVKDPVHVIFFRVRGATLEIIRVLHERMDPARHLDA